MQNATATLVLMLFMAALMALAGISDLRTRTISNGLNGAMALLAVPFWFVAGMEAWPDVAIQIGAALGVFFLFAGLFAIGAMGGGDVKMIGAVLLWVPLSLFIETLTVMAVGGGLLSAAMLVHSKLRPPDKPVEVPYGVAIAVAGLWALHQHYLNQFQAIAVS